MSWHNTPDRYGSLAVLLHWAMLLLIFAVYACMELRGFFPRGSDARVLLKMWHFMLGLSVLVLVVLRLLIRLINTEPKIQPEPPAWQMLSAKWMHVALYLLMFSLPLAGWLILSAAGAPIPFFGLQLPALIAENKLLAGVIKEVHETGAAIGYGLIGLHAAAALYHHYFVRDNTLRRMLPWGK